jgi:hypothetical protein
MPANPCFRTKVLEVPAGPRTVALGRSMRERLSRPRTELPAPNDGGAEDSAVPHNKFGMTESVNVTSPPVLGFN